MNNINIFFVGTDCSVSDKDSFLLKRWTVLCLWCPVFFWWGHFPRLCPSWFLKNLFCSNIELFCVCGVRSFGEDISQVCVPLFTKESVFFKHWIVLCPVFWRGHFPCWNVPSTYQRICFVETFTCFVSRVFGLLGRTFPLVFCPCTYQRKFSLECWTVLCPWCHLLLLRAFPWFSSPC